MSAVESKSRIELWTSWEGHVVNGVYLLRRYLGCADHSGVFLADSRKGTPSDVAIKIVPAVPGRAEAQLSRWLSAAAIDHPNLVRIFEAGQCQVDGRPYIYALMEYADQDLGQLLQRRSLTEEETREMLGPALTALGFLHSKKLVQGRVKPSNVLVVGDQLKLASDTIRRAGEAVAADVALSAYEPPELREVGYTPAADMWALGVTICEALTRRQPLGLHGAGTPVLPVDLSQMYREVVAWCLSRRPSDRPEVAEFEASLRGERTVPVAIPAVEPSAMVDAPGGGTAEQQSPVLQPPSPRPASAPIAAEPAASAAPVVVAGAAPSSSATTGAPAEAVSVRSSTPATHTQKGAIEVVAEEPRQPLSESNQPTPVSGSEGLGPVPGAEGSKPVSGTERSKPVSGSEGLGPVSGTEGSKPAGDTKQQLAVRVAAAVALLVVAWGGMKLLSKPSSESPADNEADTISDVAPEATPDVNAPDVVSGAPVGGLSQLPAANNIGAANTIGTTHAAATARPVSTRPATFPASTLPATTPSGSAADLPDPDFMLPSSAVTEVIPDVPASASRTIRGRVRVSVRVIVEQDGTVFAALADDRGPSRYFERLAVDAAKKWTFAPADTDEQRLMLIRFTFTREGATASASALP